MFVLLLLFVVNELWHQGFEWSQAVEEVKVSHWKELTYSKEELSKIVPKQELFVAGTAQTGIKQSTRLLLSAIKRKVRGGK